MYAVMVEHHASQGLIETLIQLTNDPARAFRTAITAENLGYRFGIYSGRVSILRREIDIAYAAKQGDDRTLVYARLRFDGKWTELWDDGFKTLIHSRL